MNAKAKLAVVLITLALCSGPCLADAKQETLSPKQCGACHKEQFAEWLHSPHATANKEKADCNRCHGALHSCELLGCKDCHVGEHKGAFLGWKEVSRFDVPGSADYYCMLCHDAHNTKTYTSGFCNQCHGDEGVHRGSVDLVHRLCSKVAPVTFDAFEREGEGRFPLYKKAMLAVGVVGSIVLFLLLWPWCYVAVVAWRKISAARRRSSS